MTNQSEVLLMKTILFLLLFPLLSFAGQAVTYKVNDAEYEGYYVSAGKNAPLILLMHDWDGLTDYEVKRSEMLAKQGYSVFALDLFGKGVRPTEVKDKKQHTGELYKDRAKMRALMDGALQVAKSQGGNVDNAIAMGYCFGGAAVLEMARSGSKMNGFVSFHGGLKTPKGQDYSKSSGKVLVMHGSADTAISMSDFAGLTNDLEKAGVHHEMVTYSGAPHAFTVFGSKRYQKEADEKSWDLFLRFLKENT